MKIMSVDGVAPTKENIGSGKYPFYLPMFLTANPESGKYQDAKKFIDWVLSKEGQKIIDEVGNVNIQTCRSLSAKYQYWESKDRIVNILPQIN